MVLLEGKRGVEEDNGLERDKFLRPRVRNGPTRGRGRLNRYGDGAGINRVKNFLLHEPVEVEKGRAKGFVGEGVRE